MEMTKDVETYLLEGCGRCQLGGTPDCKVHFWTNELKELRRIALSCGLEETSKWGVMCYMINGKNVALISALKDYAALSFFKGILLSDEMNYLVKPGEHSHEDRVWKFTDTKDILELEDAIRAYLFEAIEVEKAGIPIPARVRKELDPPEELIQKFSDDPAYKAAFEALTPGRQRGYLIHFSQAKQSQTRISRIEKCKEKIFLGKGFNEY
jgi:uncharacterized protein YdeI (YjbR/CyaY-like superfamily)